MNEKTTSFRIDSELLEKIKSVAKSNSRTARAEIERALRDRFCGNAKTESHRRASQ